MIEILLHYVHWEQKIIDCRWQDVARENRKCLLCNSGDIGDEFHYIFMCSVFNDDRKQFWRKR